MTFLRENSPMLSSLYHNYGLKYKRGISDRMAYTVVEVTAVVTFAIIISTMKDKLIASSITFVVLYSKY